MKTLNTALFLLVTALLSTTAVAETYWLNIISVFDKGDNAVMSLPTSNAESCYEALGYYVKNDHVAAISCDVRPLGK